MRSSYQLWQRQTIKSLSQGHGGCGPDKGRHQQRPKDHRQDLSAQQDEALVPAALCGRRQSMTSHSIRLTSRNGWSALSVLPDSQSWIYRCPASLTSSSALNLRGEMTLFESLPKQLLPSSAVATEQAKICPETSRYR